MCVYYNIHVPTRTLIRSLYYCVTHSRVHTTRAHRHEHRKRRHNGNRLIVIDGRRGNYYWRDRFVFFENPFVSAISSFHLPTRVYGRRTKPAFGRFSFERDDRPRSPPPPPPQYNRLSLGFCSLNLFPITMICCGITFTGSPASTLSHARPRAHTHTQVFFCINIVYAHRRGGITRVFMRRTIKPLNHSSID